MKNTNYSFLFLMDPYVTLNLETETSLALMTELLNRGHAVYWLEESGLRLKNGLVWGEISEVTQVRPFHMKEQMSLRLDEFDALLVRKDPPFDQQYLHLTLMLDHLPTSMMQFNSVAALRNFNEKLLPLRWPDLTPESLITSNAQQILDFLEQHQTIVLKPLDDCSGRGIARLQFDVDDLSRIEFYLQSLSSSPYVIAQRFLTEVSAGDKRVYLVDGKAAGWVNRIPQPGQFLANIHQGAHCESTVLTNNDQRAIKKIGPFLQEQGIFFAGLDFIGGYLTEVNITSPSAILQINQAMQERIEVKLVDGMLNALQGRQKDRNLGSMRK